MTAHTAVATPSMAGLNKEKRHRLFVVLAYLVVFALIAAVTIYGFDYYTLDSAQRPFSAKHEVLKPSGSIGIKLGMLGFGMFCLIFLYPLRKKITWLQQWGTARHWLDYHIVLGISAPFIIALHSSFKFRGLAGMAFWIMLSVSLSGIVGRYLYAQIHRGVSATEISLKEAREAQTQMTEQLAQQKVISPGHLKALFKLPTEEDVTAWPTVFALIYMVILDIARPFHVARLRCRTMSGGQVITSLGGLLPSKNVRLEQVIALAREQASLSKRLVFLSRSQQVFHLWHVVHKPFSYSFAVLAIVHIVVVMMLGFM
ncbi:MAG TPA: hypothetical protein VKW78_18925 [Terriglobales bacterium]|nr:hypothetical protein [Terriglobales bacterium]